MAGGGDAAAAMLCGRCSPNRSSAVQARSTISCADQKQSSRLDNLAAHSWVLVFVKSLHLTRSRGLWPEAVHQAFLPEQKPGKELGHKAFPAHLSARLRRL